MAETVGPKPSEIIQPTAINPSSQPVTEQAGIKPTGGLYEKPELTKHEDLSQITFSADPDSSPVSPTTTVGILTETKRVENAQVAASKQRIDQTFNNAAKQVTIDPNTKRRIR